MSGLFNSNMTYPEAQKVFFGSVIGKSEAERTRIKNEYRAILPELTRKELSSKPNRLTEHPMNSSRLI